MLVLVANWAVNCWSYLISTILAVACRPAGDQELIGGRFGLYSRSASLDCSFGRINDSICNSGSIFIDSCVYVQLQLSNGSSAVVFANPCWSPLLEVSNACPFQFIGERMFKFGV